MSKVILFADQKPEYLSKIINKTRLLNFTNAVSDLIAILGFSLILSPIPEEYKHHGSIILMIILTYSALNGNKTAQEIIKERKLKGDIINKGLSFVESAATDRNTIGVIDTEHEIGDDVKNEFVSQVADTIKRGINVNHSN